MEPWNWTVKELNVPRGVRRGVEEKERQGTRRRPQPGFCTYRAGERQPAATRKRFTSPQRKDPPEAGPNRTHAAFLSFCFLPPARQAGCDVGHTLETSSGSGMFSPPSSGAGGLVTCGSSTPAPGSTGWRSPPAQLTVTCVSAKLPWRAASISESPLLVVLSQPRFSCLSKFIFSCVCLRHACSRCSGLC